jgi:hypothetical protein
MNANLWYPYYISRVSTAKTTPNCVISNPKLPEHYILERIIEQ